MVVVSSAEGGVVIIFSFSSFSFSLFLTLDDPTFLTEPLTEEKML